MKYTTYEDLLGKRMVKQILESLEAEHKVLKKYGIQPPEAMIKLLGPWRYSKAFSHIGKDEHGYYL